MNNVQTLNSKGYQIATSGNTITVTSSTPFKVTKGRKVVSAHQVDGKYTLATEGLILNDTVPFIVESVAEHAAKRSSFPLLGSLIKESVKTTRTNIAPFFSIGLNETFKIEGDSTLYQRDGVRSYRKHANLLHIGQSTTVSESFNVIVENDWFSLTPDQITDLAGQIPPGIEDPDEVFDIIHSMLEDIPGMEMPEASEKAASQIYNVYISAGNDGIGSDDY